MSSIQDSNSVVISSLLETIKKDGHQKAEEEKKVIINSAKAEAEEILKSAKAEALKILEESKNNAKQTRESGEAALRQAGRDLILEIKKELEGVFESIVRESVKEVYNKQVLENAIVTAVKEWALQPNSYSIHLNSKDLSELEASLKGKLKEKLSSGVKLKGNLVGAGFTLQEKDGKSYYDFSDETITQVILSFLNPSFKQIMSGK